jgi:hypothetical protein
MTDRRRNGFNRAAVASALVAGILLVLIIRGWFVSDTFCIASPNAVWQMQLHRGGLLLYVVDWGRARGMIATNAIWTRERPAATRVWPEWNVKGWDDDLLLGFGLTAGDGFTVTRVPLLYLLLLSTILPLWWWRHPLRRRPQRFNICTGCGYDLRGSSERCPECGLAFERAPIVTPPPAARGAIRDLPARQISAMKRTSC